MRVLFATTELFPIMKVGGLGDVSAALPAALRALNTDVRLILPRIPAYAEAILDQRLVCELGSFIHDEPVRIYRGRTPDSDLVTYLVDCPALYQRPGTPYSDGYGVEWSDSHIRFATFAWAIANLKDGHWQAELIHGNDWHTGLVPLYLRAHGARRPAFLFTIHNLAYQGLFDLAQAHSLQLPADVFSEQGGLHHQQLSFLKTAIRYADHITTVSPSYAREIQSAPQGCGLEQWLRQRSDRLTGILNGVDYEVWNPANDAHLAFAYSLIDPRPKSSNKTVLQVSHGFTISKEKMMVAVVSRLAAQKGLDILLAALPRLFNLPLQFLLVGTGDANLERDFTDFAKRHNDAMAVHWGHHEDWAHKVIAGADVVLVPSRFEPCGLTQLYGLRYGTLPVVHRVGGLADTVVDANTQNLAQGLATGFCFDEPSVPALIGALERALAVFHQPAQWQAMQVQAMRRDFSWDQSAEHYLHLYRHYMPDI